MPSNAEVSRISATVIGCSKCPRLVGWREASAQNPPARFRGQSYWARPLPGFGDPDALLMIVGLAPAAHGGNRTGRIFTGDRSGDWLFRSLHRAGYASQPESVSRDDGLVLDGCYVTAVVRCAPPANKPLPSERDNCIGYLTDEIDALAHLSVIVALGGFAWDGVMRALGAKPRPKFGHGVVVPVGELKVIGSYHPSQQNTFTGRLTEKMLDDVFATARRLSDEK